MKLQAMAMLAALSCHFAIRKGCEAAVLMCLDLMGFWKRLEDVRVEERIIEVPQIQHVEKARRGMSG